MSIGVATFWALCAGICFSGCRLLLQNIQLNVIDVSIVGGVVQVRQGANCQTHLKFNRNLSS